MRECSECSENLYLIEEFPKVYEKIIFKKIFLFFSWKFSGSKNFSSEFHRFWMDFDIITEFWKVNFDPKRSSGSGSELSAGAQTLSTCATHQLGRLRKFERKIFTLSGEISIFQFAVKITLSCQSWQSEYWFSSKSKNRNFFTQSEYFSLKLS